MLKIEQKNFEYFQIVYRDMLKQFPAAELKSFENFNNMFKNSNYCLYSVNDKDNAVGYFMLFKDLKSKILWLDYIAIIKEYQSKGYGHRIFEELKQHFSSDFNGIYLEVEKPVLNKKNTIRRINFYENIGAKKLDINYFYPNKAGGLPMNLYFLPFNNSPLPLKNTILQTIREVFKNIHNDCKSLECIFDKIN